jgi:hypothetical protein
LILLLALFVEHENLNFVFTLRPAVRWRREIESSRAAAGQIESRLKSRDRSALLSFDVFDGQPSLYFHLAGSIRNIGNRIDRISTAEATGLRARGFVFAKLQAADVSR